MPIAKLKNLVILILVMANLLLILLVVPGRVATRQEQDDLRESLCALYDEADISLSPQIIPETIDLYMLELKENQKAEEQAAAALLGEQLLVQDDSTRYLSSYRSSRGACSISRTGSFSAQLEQQPENGDLSKGGRRILKDMGFSIHGISQPLRIRAGVYTITATQSILGVPVLSDGLTLTFSNSCLTSLEGTFFTGTETMTRISDTGCLSAADVLVAFLSARYSLGWVGSAVTGMEQGYVRSETAAAAAVRLTPVWRLETDTGPFLINGMTGEVTPA